MTQIAIIGIKGAGKTVFATVWANRMESRGNAELGYIELVGNATKVYVRDAYAKLTSGIWCDPTQISVKHDLEFILHLDGRQHAVKLIDAAGEDLANLFRLDKDASIEIDKELLLYVQKADILLLIVNLRDFFGESDHKKLWRTASIYAEAIEAIQKTRKKQKIAIIWTAWDLYERHVNRQGGIKKYLLEGENGLLVFFQNAIDDAIRAGCVIESFMVAPVEAVELPSDNSTTGKSVPHNPMVISIPKKGFKSPGLKQISAWIAQTVREQVEQDAKNNDPDALCTMGRRYIYGYGALKNEHEGFKIFHRLATEFKYPYAMYCLAHFYYFGQGVRQDKKEAHKWFKQAVESGSINAKDRLRELYKNGEEEFLKIEFDEMTKFVMASKFEIKERDAKIENLNAKITNLNIQVEDLNTKIAVKEDEVSTANNRLAECIEQWYKLFKNICGWFFWKRLFFWKATVKKEYESTVDEEFRP